MCTHCGCSSTNEIIVTNLQTGDHVHLHGEFDPDAPAHAHHHDHGHGHEHPHAHAHPHEPAGAPASPPSRTIRIEQELLARNTRLAERNRGWLAGRGVTAINLMSSPGAGKTTLLEATLKTLGQEVTFHVIEGDQATLRDAERIRAAGGKAVQVNTGTGCHLDAAMVAAALRQSDPAAGAVVVIENVGNLVCPALFDLGEQARVVVASVPEGDDKPSKYPHMFRAADVVVLNKIDLCPHVNFDLDAFDRRVRELNPGARLFRLSATHGTGMNEWLDWLRASSRKKPELSFP